MPRTTGYGLICIAGALLAASASPAIAADEDTQLWTTVTAMHTLAQGLEGSFELSPRLRSDEAGGDQLLTTALLDYRIAPSVTLGGGVAYLEYSGGDELRTLQQLSVSAGRLSFRTRLEERFVEGAERMEMRLRQRVQMTFPLDEDTALTAAGEVFGTVRPRSRDGEARVEQWRASLLLRHGLAPGLTGGLGYLLVVAPRKGAPDRLSHVPQVTLAWRI